MYYARIRHQEHTKSPPNAGTSGGQRTQEGLSLMSSVIVTPMGGKADRTAAADRIVAAGGAAELAVQPGMYAVIDSHGSGRAHVATVDSCDCRDFQYRGHLRPCKHIITARRLAGIEVCSECGSFVEAQPHYVGGRGVCTFMVCTTNKAHKARRVE
jgi:hypothetical protein